METPKTSWETRGPVGGDPPGRSIQRRVSRPYRRTALHRVATNVPAPPLRTRDHENSSRWPTSKNGVPVYFVQDLKEQARRQICRKPSGSTSARRNRPKRDGRLRQRPSYELRFTRFVGRRWLPPSIGDKTSNSPFWPCLVAELRAILYRLPVLFEPLKADTGGRLEQYA